MSEAELHHALTWAQIGLAVLTAGALLLFRAPYGRHYRKGWGPSVPAWLGWVIMESPAVLLFVAIYLRGDHALQLVPLLLLGLWQLHYVHRTFVYPFRQRSPRPMPLVIALAGVIFNSLNAYINARWISHLGDYSIAWLADPRPWIGGAVFATGYAINKRADRMLLALRRPGEGATRSRGAGCTSGSRAPTTWARSSSGWAGPSPPGRCRAWPLRSTPRPTWDRGRWPTTAGIASSSTTIRAGAGR